MHHEYTGWTGIDDLQPRDTSVTVNQSSKWCKSPGGAVNDKTPRPVYGGTMMYSDISGGASSRPRGRVLLTASEPELHTLAQIGPDLSKAAACLFTRGYFRLSKRFWRSAGIMTHRGDLRRVWEIGCQSVINWRRLTRQLTASLTGPHVRWRGGKAVAR